MVISRAMRRLLLVAALCLPLQVLPNGAAKAATSTAATASSASLLGELAGLAQTAFIGTVKLTGSTLAGGLSLTKDGLSWLLSTEGASVAATAAAIYGAPKLYKYFFKNDTKKAKRQAGNFVGNQVLKGWDAVKETGQAYTGLARYGWRKAWNFPTYAVASLYSGLGWDKTNRKDNRPDGTPSLGDSIKQGKTQAVDAYLGQFGGFAAWEYNDGNQGLSSGITGLMLACRFARPIIAEKFLFAYTGNVDNQDKNGRSALMHAVIVPQELKNAIARQADAAQKRALFSAQERNRAKIVQDLITFPVQIQLKDKQKRNALMYAAASGLLTVTKLIADAMEDQGYDLNDQDELGKTALVHAVEHGHVGTVKLLLTHNKNNRVTVNDGASDGSDALAAARRLAGKLATELKPLFAACEARCNAHAEQILRNYERQYVVELGTDDVPAVLQQQIDALMLQENPVLVRKYHNALAMIALLEKAAQDNQPLDHSPDANDLGNSDDWLQDLGDIADDAMDEDPMNVNNGFESHAPAAAEDLLIQPEVMQTTDEEQTVMYGNTRPVVRLQSPATSQRRVNPALAAITQRHAQQKSNARDTAARRQASPARAAASPQDVAWPKCFEDERGQKQFLVFDRDAQGKRINQRYVSQVEYDAIVAKKMAAQSSGEHSQQAPHVQKGNETAYARLAEQHRAKQRQINGAPAQARAQKAH